MRSLPFFVGWNGGLKTHPTARCARVQAQVGKADQPPTLPTGGGFTPTLGRGLNIVAGRIGVAERKGALPAHPPLARPLNPRYTSPMTLSCTIICCITP
jgi:hypothetical protein